ncbi:MAG: hypothetical protein ACRDHW_02300 [Ktedonobacteraceae bacterium]
MVLSFVTLDEQANAERRAKALALYEQVKAWPHWEEVYLNCVEESPMSYEAFAQAVHLGDDSRQASNRAMQASQMSREQFTRYLPAFQQFVTLCTLYPNIGMLSDGADQVRHAFMLITDRYGQFCRDIIGQIIEHLPCSLYELYGVTPPQASSNCVSSCLPSTCQWSGGGGCTKSDKRENADPASIKQSILAFRMAFLLAYQEVFQQQPDPAIWNQLAHQPL